MNYILDFSLGPKLQLDFIEMNIPCTYRLIDAALHICYRRVGGVMSCVKEILEEDKIVFRARLASPTDSPLKKIRGLQQRGKLNVVCGCVFRQPNAWMNAPGVSPLLVTEHFWLPPQGCGTVCLTTAVPPVGSFFSPTSDESVFPTAADFLRSSWLVAYTHT
jgi:hypothetical protein